jgi:uncharacterized membrane protein YfcA
MLLGISFAMIAACLGVVFIGSVVQGTLGIGLGMVSAPLLALADREFIPGAILVAVIPLTIAMAIRERAAVDTRGVGFALVGRVPGVVLGAFAVALTGERFLAILVAATVLAAVAASAASIRFPSTDSTILAAGAASGFMGTTTGVGGPPMALTYQHSDPAVMRSTVSAFFTVGAMMSIGGLILSGAVGTRQLQLGLLLVPAVILGFFASQVFATRLRDDRTRPLILALCALSAIALLVEEFT